MCGAITPHALASINPLKSLPGLGRSLLWALTVPWACFCHGLAGPSRSLALAEALVPHTNGIDLKRGEWCLKLHRELTAMRTESTLLLLAVKFPKLKTSRSAGAYSQGVGGLLTGPGLSLGPAQAGLGQTGQAQGKKEGG